MLQVGRYIFKRADAPEEFEQIHRLNYQTFVSEIPQHPDPGNERLVDKFHHKNEYFIAIEDDQVVGMVCGHDQPPFSVADRLEDPEIIQRPGMRPLEVRLLAVRPEKRNSSLFFGLLWMLYEHARNQGYTHLLLSGIEARLPLYKRLGCKPLGPAVPCGQAAFVPMAIAIGHLPARLERVKQLWETHIDREQGKGWLAESPSSSCKEICLLPGPVMVAPRVRQAFRQPAIYHRGMEFITLFGKVRQTLGEMTGGRDVGLLTGSGTLANEAVAAMLAADGGTGRGLLLVNGEFGQRLARQATRFGLKPRILNWSWGYPWDLNEVNAALADEPTGSWVWGVHQESSTGVLNDLPGLVRMARARGIRVCADCISSLGAVPLDLREVFLATGATGKSLGSYAGLGIVFARATDLAHIDTSRVPSYLDVPAILASEGPRYTFPSATVRALDAALDAYRAPEQAQMQYERYAALGAYVRMRLRQLELPPLASGSYACPVITTFAPPRQESAPEFVARCRSWGFVIGGQSQYLAERHLVQIATMGAVTREDCAPLFDHLTELLGRKPATEMVSV
jgi:aspartate aminotransferase-like enzyme